MKIQQTKFKLLVMLIVLVLVSLLLPSCNTSSKLNEDFLLQKFNLDDGQINFLTIRSINIRGTQREVWGSSFMLSGDSYEEKELYSRPYIAYSTTIDNSDLGDGRTFYEKYIKRYLSFSGSPKYSMKISMVSYAFQGEIVDLKYEFDSLFTKGEKIKIYNGDEYIAVVSVTTKLDMPNEFYKEILDESLFVISADKYSAVELGTTPPNQDEVFIEPDLDIMKLSYLSIRNTNASKEKINAYKSSLGGGYSSVEWQTGYKDVVNNVQIDFYDSSLNANLEINAEFYEYREKMGTIDYVFTKDEENGNCIELYSYTVLVGKVFYGSDIEISEEWLINFLNENLVVISIQK